MNKMINSAEQSYEDLNKQLLTDHRRQLTQLLSSLHSQEVDSEKEKQVQKRYPLKFSPQNKEAHLKSVQEFIKKRKFQSDEHEKIVSKMQGRLMIWKIYYKFCSQLNLTGLNIGLYGVMNLGIINGINSLTILKLGSNFIGNESLRMLANRDMSILQELHLQNNYIGSRGIKHLLQGRWSNMSKLNLSHNPLGQEGIKYLSRWKVVGNLISLGLQNCGIMGNQIHPLFAFGFKVGKSKAKGREIQQINLKKNQIDYWGFISLVYASRACPHLKSIIITDNHISTQMLVKQVLPVPFRII